MTWLDEFDDLLGIDVNDPGWPTHIPCERCGRGNRLGGDSAVHRRCRNNQCVEERCANCDHYWGGWGPAGCRCESGGPNPLLIDGHAYHRRTRARRKNR